MDLFFEDADNPGHRKNKTCTDRDFTQPGSTDTTVQLVISLLLGVSAFFAFCALRPKWKTLYAARKRRFDPSSGVPALPDTFFGWIPALYRVTEQQVLASAGLDAFVFLAFFKMSIRLFGIMFLFAAVVLEPINMHFIDNDKKHRDTDSYMSSVFRTPQSMPFQSGGSAPWTLEDDGPDKDPDRSFDKAMGYLWSYLVFTYFFSMLTMYFMDKETRRVIRVRQDYLGTQLTITDRTFRLSGIPKDLRTEENIKDLVEKLEIGKVESVTLCRNWKELDKLVEERQALLIKLEETWSVYLKQKTVHNPAAYGGNRTNHSRQDHSQDVADEEAGETGPLITGPSTGQLVERRRPQTRIWYGFLNLQSRTTDAVDYYEEKLRRLDEKIREARKRSYDAADLAFVTMDSIAACQMAIQALIDPRPGQLLTKPAPAPSDVVWANTYSSRFQRNTRAWSITIFVAILTVIWLIPVAFLASSLSLCTIKKFFPSFASSLSRHEITRALIQTGLPTAVVSLLNAAVPYLYDYLSYYQGMLSRGDVALSVISKVFFFTFFNFFLVFTLFGTASEIWSVLRESFKDTTTIASTMAAKIQNLSVFYLNFIMLQGLGLFPFRLLEFGSVAMYPIYRMGAKTPRDHAQMVEPPVFTYAFYLPTALLVFILCLVYSVLPGGYLVLLLGVVFFTLGYFTYKYQLLYAMDQPQHATGGAWRIICYRIMLGLVVFQLTMSGVLALKFAYFQATGVLPLLIGTLWYAYEFRHRFEPLTRFISLRSIKRNETGEDPGADAILDEDFSGDEDVAERLRRGSTVDEDREKGLRFVNPSLVVP
ncbi:DUF221-domain-containing protein [Coniochaeta ligniaria NRRL 30616]|uniref:DUF221-domain-containing protein n=1 Tax=Coniochaeta ligniaria NRRL 30616 TaxID=1408157 RepID=A0A1J7J5C7_9PEZI|nr:DUF221-domain-containing protein [Coniochaeta ligniaria NRRL 30616]